VSLIDPTARVAGTADIAADAEIGPFCVIGPQVKIGAGVKLVSHVNVAGVTEIGAGTLVHPFASLGGPPQSVHYKGEPTRLVIGSNCQIRESVTANTGTVGGGGVTTIGDNCFLMAGTHVAHDCHLGHNVIFANNSVIGGHVEIGENVFLGGHCAVHQFVRIGENAMIGGFSAVKEDVIPYGYVVDPMGRLGGINVVGMKRRGFSKADLHVVRRAFLDMFEGGEGTFAERVEKVAASPGRTPAVDKIVAFIRGGKRPIMMARKRGDYNYGDQ
jgi:UDP-N-acetylglucosamine acyltransferase